MNRNLLTIVTAILCGIPGMIACLGGTLVFLFGAMANTSQLKLDTNLDRSSVIIAAVFVMVIGVVLIAIPIVLWLKRSPSKSL